MSDYDYEAKEDAIDMVNNFIDDIIGQILDKGKASHDFNNDYSNGDSYFHENYVDKSYSLFESAELLDELSEFEETDRGLWEGLEPRDAIAVQAAFTYGNSVAFHWNSLIENINEEAEEVLDDEDLPDDEDEKRDILTEMIERVCEQY